MLHIAVCDDEEYFGKRIGDIISKYMEKSGYQYHVHCFPSGKELLFSVSGKFDYDIVFLDVNMEEMDGIETAEAIRAMTEHAYIVFVTGFIHYALEGYKVNAVRYILKEDCCLESSLWECLDAILKKMGEQEKKITFVSRHGNIETMPSKILYAESRLHKVIFFLINEGIVERSIYGKLNDVETILKPYGFCRIHQSYLVNMKYVRSIARYKIGLFHGTELNISKKYYKETEKEYIKMRGEI